MGSRIAVLPPEVAARIAAGEVIERPASAVKELVENALDAGARRVDVELEAGGTRLIRVRDDGHGMSPEDARLALERHATSKLRSLDDLWRLQTLGFRGEALPSIAAVSRLEIITRERDAPAGFRIVVSGGRLLEEGPVGAAAGTTVTVRDLFFNTPVRRRSLRSAPSELARILAMLAPLALGHPAVAFRCVHDGREVLATSGGGDLLAAGAEILGAATGRALLALEGRRGPVRVRGFVGAPWVARGDRAQQHLIVNGRAVVNAGLREAIERPFRHLLPLHRHPLAVVIIDLPADQVDVNVHPSKREVRFSDEATVLSLVHDAVEEALSRARLIGPLLPRLDAGAADAAAADAPAPAALLEPGEAEPGARASMLPLLAAEARAPYGAGDPAPNAPAGSHHAGLPALRPLTVLDDTFIVAEGPDGLYVVDQHAAHERVTFERLLRAGRGEPPPRQRLAVPLPVELAPDEFATWEANREVCEAYGYVAEPFGPAAILLREVPVLYGGPDGPYGLRALLAALAGLAWKASRPGAGTCAVPADLAGDLARRILASCKASVKAHDRLATPEVEALLRQLGEAEEPWTCPHGRPTVLRLSVAALAHHFKR